MTILSRNLGSILALSALPLGLSACGEQVAEPSSAAAAAQTQQGAADGDCDKVQLGDVVAATRSAPAGAAIVDQLIDQRQEGSELLGAGYVESAVLQKANFLTAPPEKDPGKYLVTVEQGAWTASELGLSQPPSMTAVDDAKVEEPVRETIVWVAYVRDSKDLSVVSYMAAPDNGCVVF